MTSIPPPASAAPVDPRPAEPPRPRRAAWSTALRWTAAVLLFAWSIVFAAWLVLQWGILPRLDAWRPQLEARASQALGVPVRLGAVVADEGGGPLRWARAIELRDVRLLDPASGDERLHLPSVRAALSPTSLLPGWDGRWRLRFEQLLIEGPSLDVRRGRDGRLSVAGLELGRGDAAEGSQAADWFFSQHEFAIRGGTLTWTDALRDAPPLALRSVDLVVRNGVRRHDLRLDATPPDGWGERFSLRGRFTQPLLAEAPGVRGGGLLARPGDWRRWRGTVYAELPAVDLAPLQRHVTLPLAPSAGAGALRAWVELRDARPVNASADLALRDLVLPLDAGTEPLAFARLDGRLAGRFDARGGRFSAERLAFALADGREWPASDLQLDWRLDAQGALAGGELRAQRLDLGLLAGIVGRMPARWVGEPLAASLASLAPQGLATAVQARWDGALPAPPRYRVDARLAGLQLAAAPAAAASAVDADPTPGRPGVQGAEVDLHATEAGGRARLALRDGALEFPGVFAEPRVALERLDGELAWRIEPGRDGAAPRVELKVSKLSFANADAAGSAEASWSSAADPAGGAGTLALNGRLERGDAARVARYLPLQMNDEARDYVGAAVLAGRVRSAEFKLRGDLRHFPFDGAQAADGEFRVAAQVEGVRYDVAPGPDGEGGGAGEWPRLDEVRGELVFDRASLQLRGLQGRLAGVGSGGITLSGVRGTVADLDADDATLVIEGNGRGPLADALRFVAEAPLGDALRRALAPVEAAGGRQAPAELQLALTLPINDSERSTVRGRLALAGNDLRLRPGLPPLAEARARIAFSESSFSLAEGSARVLGGDARFDGAMQPDGSLRFDVQGQASLDALKRSPELGDWSRAAAPLSGQAAYRLALGIADGRVDARLGSDLTGLAIDLPAPLGKPAAAALPLRVRLEPVAAAGAPREQLRLALGPEDAPLLQAAWLREAGPDGPRVLRGGLGVFDAAPEPAEGVSASLKLAELDVDAWQRAVERMLPADGAGGTALASGGYAPSRVALQAGVLRFGDRRLHQVVAGLTRSVAGPDAGLWRFNADATELTGYGEYHPSGVRAAEGAGRVFARLARLSLPKTEAEAVSSLLEQAAPARVPALDIVVDDFELRGKRLGRVEIAAQNRAAAGGGAGWQLDRLRLVNPDATLLARGEWVPAERAGARRRTELDFQLDVADGGALLARLGEAGLVRGAKGQISGRIDWLGSPLQIDYPSLGGEMKVAIDRGQFLQAEPGIAKLLGVLSLQSLPRRLLFDFRDVFGSGFVFDSLRGDVSVAGGVASTRNLRMRGVQAVVAMEGRADIAQETQDLRVWIVPEINAGSASLAYAVINPAVGLGSFIAQWLLRRPIAEAGTRELHVTGPWDDPKVEPVERRPGAPLPAAAAEPASAPASAPVEEHR